MGRSRCSSPFPPRLAGKLVAHIPPNCWWMSRRRCFHSELKLPNHPWQWFSKVVCNDRMTLHCRGEPGPEHAPGRRRSSGLFFEGNRLLELLSAAEVPPEAAEEASEPSSEAEGLASESAAESESSKASEEPYSALAGTFGWLSRGQWAKLSSRTQIAAGRHEFLPLRR